jgi:parallel beta-helix repeat protein
MKKTALIVSCILVCLLVPSLSSSSKKDDSKKKEITPEEDGVISAPIIVGEEETVKTDRKRGRGVLTGTIVDETGSPVSGVQVSCINSEGMIVATVFTGTDGVYEFRDLEKGDYTLNVNYSGFENPVEIKFDDEDGLPPAPVGLTVVETYIEMYEGSYIRARWKPVRGASSYKCELYLGEEELLVEQFSEIKQIYCEFGDLKEDTQYRLRVYSKNERGFSTQYTEGSIRTVNKPPLPPYGLGITYAKNNRVELIWKDRADEDIKGYVLQIKKFKGKYLYYSKEGLVTDPAKAFVIPSKGGGYVTLGISDRLPEGIPLIENALPYSFRVRSADNKGAFSKPSTAVEGIILDDTVPPNPPVNIAYEFVGQDRLRITWETRDNDIVRYTLYYGVNKNRWDGVAYTSSTFYELIVNRERLRNKELYITVTATDRAGNESGYKPLIRKATVEDTGVTEDIVLSADNLYRSYSVAVKDPGVSKVKKVTAKKVAPKKPVYPASYGIKTLRAKNYVVEKGEKATLRGKIRIPEKTKVRVMNGGTLIIEDAELTSSKGKWGGVQYLRGSAGTISNTVISEAAFGIEVLNNIGNVRINNIEVKNCNEIGIHVKNSTLRLSVISLIKNEIGLFAEDSNVSIRNALVEENEKGILIRNYRFTIDDAQFKRNRIYGLRVYGSGLIEGCYVRENLAGIVIEEGKGKVLVSGNTVELNRMDGIVVNTSQSEIKKNLVANNGRHGIYLKENANPDILENDIVSNSEYAVVGGGKIIRCYVAYNNGSTYIDDTKEKGRPDSIFSSSSSGLIKQIFNVDYINDLAFGSVLH